MMHLLMLLLLFNPQAQRAEMCTVSGTVVDAGTGEALNKVDVLLEPVERAATHTAITVSDAKGRFALVDLDCATYSFHARRNGYLEASKRVRLEPGQKLGGLALKLVRAAVIAGTVRDGDGEPLEGAHVILARRRYLDGNVRVQGEDSIDTDDRGEYRFRGLAAGRYFIGVEPKSHDWDQVDHSPSVTLQGTVPAFYPGVTDLTQAMAIEVTAGRRVNGVDVTLVHAPVFRVSGRVLNGPPNRFTVTLRDSRNREMRDHDLRTSTRNAEGDFEFRGVPPGSYDVLAGTTVTHARTSVTVGSSDVEGVRLTMAPGAEVRLRISAGPDEKPNLNWLDCDLTTNGRDMFSVTPMQSDRFTIHNVPPDHYAFRVGGPLLKRYYVKSARSGDVDVLADGLTIAGPGTAAIDVMLSSDGATVEGVVRNQEGQSVAGATVVLAPDVRSRVERFASTTTDQNGRYELGGIAPGDYKLFAWAEEPEAWNDPEYLAGYDKHGEKAAFEEKGRAVVNLTLVPKREQP